MASHLFNAGRAWLAENDVESATIKAVPCMSNTTADTENDAIATVDDLTTLDEFNGDGYSSGGITLTNVTAAADDTNDRGKIDADDLSGLSWGDGTRQVAGFLLIGFDTSLSQSVPLGWYEFSSAADGSSITGYQWGANGIIQI